MPSALFSSVHAWLREPAVPDPPGRVWSDWALVAIASMFALGEAVLRTDDEWVGLPVGWQVAAVVVFFATMPAALLVRRVRPLMATALSFGAAVGFGVAMAVAEGPFGGLSAMSVLLVVPYALYRWGSGRDGLIGGGILIAAGVIGNLSSPDMAIGDWIGGFIVLSIPVELGLLVRYRSSARERAVREAQSSEREALARELHDTVAHHVSAIAVQAQAARAVASSDPDRALGILGVIEQQASLTLAEMRSMVGTLRHGDTAALSPRQGMADLRHLADSVVGIEVTIAGDETMPPLDAAVDSAIYRIAQESITNALRHARRASRVDVRLAVHGDLLTLTVTDDGDPSVAAPPGYGLTGMAERTQLLGGTFSAGPSDGRGWRVAAHLPLHDAVRTGLGAPR